MKKTFLLLPVFVCISIVAFSQVNPINKDTGEVRKPNGDPIPPMLLPYIAFRSTFIPADHPGLANKKIGTNQSTTQSICYARTTTR